MFVKNMSKDSTKISLNLAKCWSSLISLDTRDVCADTRKIIPLTVTIELIK